MLLERDGTLDVFRGWVDRPEDFVWMEDLRMALRWANEQRILALPS